MDSRPQLGGAPPGGPQSYRVAFEESKVRAEQRRTKRLSWGRRQTSPRTRLIAQLAIAAIIIGLMTYEVWSEYGPVVGLGALVALVVGAAALWRLWH